MSSHEGGCVCRAVRFVFTGTPLTTYACHCTRCQTRTGSAFGMSMHVQAQAIEFIAGQPLDVPLPKAGGRVLQYCAVCRTLVALKSHPLVTVLFPGTFDDTSWVAPVANIWTRSAQPWVQMAPTLRNYETQPAAFSELYGLSPGAAAG